MCVCVSRSASAWVLRGWNPHMHPPPRRRLGSRRDPPVLRLPPVCHGAAVSDQVRRRQAGHHRPARGGVHAGAGRGGRGAVPLAHQHDGQHAQGGGGGGAPLPGRRHAGQPLSERGVAGARAQCLPNNARQGAASASPPPHLIPSPLPARDAPFNALPPPLPPHPPSLPDGTTHSLPL